MSKGLSLGKPAVFIIDREADSVGHYRRWVSAGRQFLVRANDQPRVLYEGRHRPLSQVADMLRGRGAFRAARQVLLKGKPAQQFVAETTVVLDRPARTQRVNPKTGKAKHKNISGPPLPLRLVVSVVRGERGNVPARRLLLTNLPASVSAATPALWYYWRWEIESYHKLLKGAGQRIKSTSPGRVGHPPRAMLGASDRVETCVGRWEGSFDFAACDSDTRYCGQAERLGLPTFTDTRLEGAA
jgi:hypothetical protein